MPAFCKCKIPGCTFNGNHGFNTYVGGIMGFYHDAHLWYTNEIESNQTAKVKTGTIERRGTKFYLNTSSLSEAFELCVVPRTLRERKPGNSIWIEAFRAKIAGHDKKANKLFKEWQEYTLANF